MSRKANSFSHTKGHYGERSLNKIQKERQMEDSKELKFKWHKSAIGMGMRNKSIMLFTVSYNPVVSKLETS